MKTGYSFLTDSINNIGYLQLLYNYYDAQELKKLKPKKERGKPLLPDEEYLALTAKIVRKNQS